MTADAARLTLVSEPAPPAQETTWDAFVADALAPSWRTGEWDPHTSLFTGDPDNPHTGIYPCATHRCTTLIPSENGFCSACIRWRRRLQLDRAEFARTHTPPPGYADRSQAGREARGLLTARHFTLVHLSRLVRAEILYGLQQRDQEAYTLYPFATKRTVEQLPSRIDSLLDLVPSDIESYRSATHRGLLRGLIAPVKRLHLAFTGEDGTATDVWDSALVGLRSAPNRTYTAVSGQLDFRPLRQPWLREAVKEWARATRPSAANIQRTLQATTLASQTLARRPNRGEASTLSLADMTAVVDAIWDARDPDGQVYSHTHRRAMVGFWRQFLDFARPAGLLDGIPDAFSLTHHHRRPQVETHEDDLAETLPEHIIRQLDTHLDLLGATTYSNGGWREADYQAMYRTIYLIQRDTGRRNNEVTALRTDCLENHDGAWSLIYDNTKARRLRRRLPIHSDTAQTIQSWSQHLSTLPTTQDCGDLLFPTPGTRNRARRRHVSSAQYARVFARWITAIPDLIDEGLDEAGRPLLFDKAQVKPYGLRHAYAQRHADNGTPVDVLRELLDHKSLETTLGYYQVSLKRKRDAVRLIGPLTVDRHGTPAPFTDSAAYEIASVAVPFGNCTEPSNVKAGGQHCPIRYQCAGCNYFRPDVSFLPAIEQHITELAADREIARSTGADDWVIRNFTDQIQAFHGIKQALGHQLDALSEEDHTAVVDASTQLRRARAVAFIPTDQLRRRLTTGDDR